ncbi:MAG: hypothetical protein LBS11_10170 [Oscillospiraceae bacterium]|jgi:hypothetical protein|nr:hypothetical protein [Oscillospiraceae bacterium]
MLSDTNATPVIHARKRFTHAPMWAYLQRQLFTAINQSLDIILEKYLHPNGYFKWPHDPKPGVGYGAVDDAYESFHAWPLFYVLGGDDRFFDLALKEFDTINEQFGALDYGVGGHKVVEDEYYSYCDWMHQGEGNQLFYLLNLAKPGHPRLKELSERFAALFTDASKGIFDPANRVIKSPTHGAAGLIPVQPRPFGYAKWMDYYGLPFFDVPGVATLDDLKDPEKAMRMGEAIALRKERSESVINLMATSLIMNAYLHTGSDVYRQWILGYVEAWRERSAANGGLVPDNAGPDGKVGGLLDGKWYGGHYGWVWPHGYWFIAESVAAACENETLLTGDITRMDWMREQARHVLSHAIHADGMTLVPYKFADEGSIIEYDPISSLARDETLVEPNGDPVFDADNEFEEPEATRIDTPLVSSGGKFTRKRQLDGGWYEYYPMRPQPMAHAFNLTRGEEDIEILESARKRPGSPKRRFAVPFFKNAGGQEYAWLSWMSGDFPDFPEKMMEYNLALVYSRVKKTHTDTQDPSTYDDAYIQNRNPICAEGLVMLTLGSPLPLYNGGLLMSTLFYFDADQGRPGLPPDVSALVFDNVKDSVALTLVNLNPARTRRVIAQGGAFAEHTFGRVALDDGEALEVGGPRFLAQLPPNSMATFTITIARYSRTPAYWTREDIAV